jgi:hypothetical protein
MEKSITILVPRISHDQFISSFEIELLNRHIKVESVDILRQNQYLSVTLRYLEQYDDSIIKLFRILAPLEANIPKLEKVVTEISNNSFKQSNAFK